MSGTISRRVAGRLVPRPLLPHRSSHLRDRPRPREKVKDLVSSLLTNPPQRDTLATQ